MTRNRFQTTAMTLIVLVLFSQAAIAGKKLDYSETEKQFLDTVELIITAKEKKAFRKAESHATRAQLIEHFWRLRDPDLSTAVNEFEEAYKARLAYAEEHFDHRDGRIDSFTMYHLYVLLGEPDTRHLTLDPQIVGTHRHRARAFANQPPELWEYRNVGYGYNRTTLKVQFISTSAFGDYVALTDNQFTEHFLNTLKERFIVNPDIETITIVNQAGT